ncbi:MAG: UDP-N-acetylmuramoyl-L-alanine--D-glutamate ligase [Pseudomonadota bacterium]
MRRIDLFPGRCIGVLGMGRSGLAAARALAAGGAAPVCGDDRPAGREAAEREGFETADLVEAMAGLDALIVSPGAPHLYPTPHRAVAAAFEAGVPVDNDIGLFFAQRAADRAAGRPAATVVAVTGSNGKSTTAALIAHLVAEAGRPTQLGGNIGRGVFDLEPARDGEVAVLELSSYQTDLARRLDPEIAIFLNLIPDHLDRHGGMGGYFAAKAKLFASGPGRTAIVGVDEPEGRFLADRLRGGAGRLIEISATTALSRADAAFGAEGGVVLHASGAPDARYDLTAAPALQGAHNAQNAAASIAAARALGLDAAAVGAGLKSFPGLPHRMQRIAERGGVLFVNDSKATNADAAEKALLTYPRVRWILGGRAKDGGIESLRPLFGRVAKAYLIGEAQEAFAMTLRDTPHERCGAIPRAVACAAAEAEPGDVVLLAPACASFDQYPDFEKRGEDFVAAVRAVLAEAGDPAPA